jgi:hypothetical protein
VFEPPGVESLHHITTISAVSDRLHHILFGLVLIVAFLLDSRATHSVSVSLRGSSAMGDKERSIFDEDCGDEREEAKEAKKAKKAKKAAKRSADDDLSDKKAKKAAKKAKKAADNDNNGARNSLNDQATATIINTILTMSNYPSAWTYERGWGRFCFDNNQNSRNWPNRWGFYACYECECYHQWTY